MGFFKNLGEAIFGGVPQQPRQSSGDQDAPEKSQEFPEGTLAETARVREEVRRKFESDRKVADASLGLAEKQRRLEKAQAYLRKADAEGIFRSILQETWHWPSWKEKGALDDLPEYGLEVTDVQLRQTLENDHRCHGYTIAIGSQRYEIGFLDKGHGYTPDGPGARYGEVTVSRNGEQLFACAINENDSRDYQEWRLSLWGLRVLKDVSWLPDLAGFAEIVSQRASKRQKAWGDKRILDQAAEIIDPTA